MLKDEVPGDGAATPLAVIVGYKLKACAVPAQESGQTAVADADDSPARPYAFTFDRVVLLAPAQRVATSFAAETQQRAGVTVASSLAAFFRKHWPVYLYGLAVDKFVDVLYTECAVAAVRLPVGLWLDDRRRPCRDVARLIVPPGYAPALDFATALRAFGASVGGVATAGFVPGRNPLDDANLTFELLLRLGIIDQPR